MKFKEWHLPVLVALGALAYLYWQRWQLTKKINETSGMKPVPMNWNPLHFIFPRT